MKHFKKQLNLNHIFQEKKLYCNYHVVNRGDLFYFLGLVFEWCVGYKHKIKEDWEGNIYDTNLV